MKKSFPLALPFQKTEKRNNAYIKFSVKPFLKGLQVEDGVLVALRRERNLL